MQLKLIDTHAHLCDSVFDADRLQVLARAAARGISGVVAVGEDLADARKNLALAELHSEILPAAGLFPTHLDYRLAEEMYGFIGENRERLAAIGEVGLDFWAVQEEEGRALQKEIFAGFIALATELDLVLNIHSRSAGRHAVAMLLAAGAQKVQLHAFDGKASAAMPGVEAGYFFSVPPSIIRSPQKQKLIKHLPLSCLLLESDSPVLGPTAAERNEPANIGISLETIADLKKIPADEVMERVADNTASLYGSRIGAGCSGSGATNGKD